MGKQIESWRKTGHQLTKKQAEEALQKLINELERGRK